MTTLLVFLEDRRSWTTSREHLTAHFLAIPGLAATALPSEGSPVRDLGWSLVRQGRRVDVWFAVDGWGMSVDGSARAAVELAVWFRSVVPADVVVRVSDPLYSFDRPLDPGVTVDELGRWYEDHVGPLD